MKNAIKIMAALKQAFPGHNVEISHNFNAKIYCVFIDENYVGNFEERFIEQDFDNSEIEIKVKASLKNFIDFIDNTYKNEKIFDVVESRVSEGIIRHAIEKGLREWCEES